MTPREMENRAKQEVQTQDASREQTRPGRYFIPEVDIFESAEGLRLWADMPGVDEKDVEVTLQNGMLTIEGLVSMRPARWFAHSRCPMRCGLSNPLPRV